MATRYFALGVGIVYVLVGVLGFVPAFLSPPPADPDLAVDTLYGLLLGLFPVNVLHSIVHLIIGVAGVVAYRSYSGARAYAQTLAIVYGLLAIMGLIPVLNTTFGLIPLFGHDVWLHAVTAIAAAYFGFRARPDTAATRV